MTPQQFTAAYLPTAQEVSAGTGIDPLALLAQWANETDWGTSWAGAPYNLANIRNGPGGSIVTYASLDAFVLACIATWHNGFYPNVLAATSPLAQLAAIVASPWSAGHYGGSLNSFYAALPVSPASLGDNMKVVIGVGGPAGYVDPSGAGAAYITNGVVKMHILSPANEIAYLALCGQTSAEPIDQDALDRIPRIAPVPEGVNAPAVNLTAFQGAAVDLTPVLSAISALDAKVTALSAPITDIKAHVDADLK